jgi:hypothetical protein
MAIRQLRSPAAIVEAHPLRSLEFLTADLCWDEATGKWATKVRVLNGIGEVI